jgi:fructose-1,6-bisphosphatase II / sedoheptulose-1,7-bisphosphatase
LRRLAGAKNCDVADLMVCVLERERHDNIIAACRAAGARITLIGEGDVAGVIAVAQPESGIDLYLGSGGPPEEVLAAAALRCFGGQMQGRLMFEDAAQIARARQMGITDPDRIYSVTDMAKGDVLFAATGITSGRMLRACVVPAAGR